MEKPDAGGDPRGPTVKLAYVDQSRQALNDKNTCGRRSRRSRFDQGRQLRDLSRSYVDGSISRAYSSNNHRRSVGGRAQSGASGQRCSNPAGTSCCSTSRPTISDIETLRALEEALVALSGCAVVIRTTLSSTASRPTSWLRRRFASGLVRGQLSGIRRGLQATAKARTPPNPIGSATNH